MTTLDQLIEKHKPLEVDFVLPNPNGDTAVYLDLFLLYESPEDRWHKVQSLIYEYFNRNLKAYRAGNISGERLINALNFPEVKEIALGHCKKGFQGRGSAHERAENIKKFIFDNPGVREVGMNAIAEMSIEIENVGPDVLSDMVAGFAMHYLLEYTEEQVASFDLKTAEFQIARVLDVETWKWKPRLKVQLPYFETTGEPRILVPKHLVKRFPLLSSMGFYNNYLRHILKQEMEDQAQTISTIGKRPKVSFKMVAEELRRKFGTLGQAARKLAAEKSELIEKYIRNPHIFESSTRRRKKKENINWDGYITELASIPPGKETAKKYAQYLRKIFTVAYDERLLNGKLEENSEDGLFFYDVNFANNAGTPFFGQIRNQGIKAGVVIVEAKNYDASDLGNDEFNQSRAYTIANGRELVLLATRKKITERDIQRSRRHFLAQRCVILPISDEDIIALINARRDDRDFFDSLLVERLQKILTA